MPDQARSDLLARQAAYLEAIVNHLPHGISVFDRQLRLQYWNAQFIELLDLPPEAVERGVSFDTLLMYPAQRGEYGPGDPVEQVAQRRRLAEEFAPHRLERTRPNGRTHLVAGEPLFVEGQIAGFITTYIDITERKHIEEELARKNELLQSIMDNIPSGVSLIGRDLQLLACNEELKRLLDFPPELFADGLPPLETLFRFNAARGEYGPGDAEQIVADRLERARVATPHCFERIRPDGTALLVKGQPLPDGSFVTTYTDITDRKHAEERIERLANHDPLTGLANRLALDEYLRRVLAERRRDRARLAVLFLDLDHFKTINDSLGHHVGDELLIEVGRRLRANVRESDMVARLGGDEFVVVLGSVASDGGAAQAADKILACLSEPCAIGDDLLHTTPSIGISLFPDDGNEAAILMRNADAAMYHAKAQGRANFQFHSEELNQSAVQRLELERKLRKAVKEGEFELWFQPIFAATDLRLTSMEALVRWRHPQDGLIPPAQFIAVAEETGLIVPLGQWVLEAACRQARRWLDAGLPALRVAVNLSARQLRSIHVVDSVAAALETNALPRGTLELELTESSVMERPEEAAALLVRLKALGVAVSIDDFGTGHSSLAYLKRFPLDHLKIDRSFVSEIERDPSDAAIVTAAVSLAHNLGLSVIAEGVETAVQVERLSALGCDELQGYHFSTPLPAAEAEALIRAAMAGQVPNGARPGSNLG